MGEVVELRTCPVEGCAARIKPGKLMCWGHWDMVSRETQKSVYFEWDRFRTTRDRDERAAAHQAYIVARSTAIKEAARADRPCDTEEPA